MMQMECRWSERCWVSSEVFGAVVSCPSNSYDLQCNLYEYEAGRGSTCGGKDLSSSFVRERFCTPT
jgi:hypothetical protein